MPDDHSDLVPLLPIPNRTVKRVSADDSADSRVKVGHRQAITAQNASAIAGAFFLVNRFRLFLSPTSQSRIFDLFRKTAGSPSGTNYRAFVKQAVSSVALATASPKESLSSQAVSRSRISARNSCATLPLPAIAANVSKPASKKLCKAPSPATSAGLRIIRSVKRNPDFRVSRSSSVPTCITTDSCRSRSAGRQT